jgi:antitoxin component YwqK of YwqJK toxin-antitoxin module
MELETKRTYWDFNKRQVQYEEHYLNNKRHDVQRLYRENGTLDGEWNCLNNLVIGIEKWYWKESGCRQYMKNSSNQGIFIWFRYK